VVSPIEVTQNRLQHTTGRDRVCFPIKLIKKIYIYSEGYLSVRCNAM